MKYLYETKIDKSIEKPVCFGKFSEYHDNFQECFCDLCQVTDECAEKEFDDLKT